MKLQNRFLRMSDLANTSAKPAKIVIDKSTGQKRQIQAKPAKQGIVGFSAKHIYHLIAQHDFPKPIKIGRASMWRYSEVMKWMKQQGEQNEN